MHFLLATGLALIVGFIPLGKELSFQRSFVFYPYFVLGYMMSKEDWLAKLRSVNVTWGYAVLGVYIILIAVIPHIPLSMLVQFHYYAELGSVPSAFAMRICSYFWMLPLAIAVLRIIPDEEWFADEGRNSLFYYLYHPFLIGVFHIMSVHYGINTTLPFILLYSVMTMFVLQFLSKCKVLSKLTKPF